MNINKNHWLLRCAQYCGYEVRRTYFPQTDSFVERADLCNMMRVMLKTALMYSLGFILAWCLVVGTPIILIGMGMKSIYIGMPYVFRIAAMASTFCWVMVILFVTSFGVTYFVHVCIEEHRNYQYKIHVLKIRAGIEEEKTSRPNIFADIWKMVTSKICISYTVK